MNDVRDGFERRRSPVAILSVIAAIGAAVLVAYFLFFVTPETGPGNEIAPPEVAIEPVPGNTPGT